MRSNMRTVKAREHYGAKSLDLTIPAEIRRKYRIEPGDIFVIEVEEIDGYLVLKYKRVYCASKDTEYKKQFYMRIKVIGGFICGVG